MSRMKMRLQHAVRLAKNLLADPKEAIRGEQEEFSNRGTLSMQRINLRSG